MKTAKEWVKELRHESSYGEPAETMEHRIVRIQLDAFKAGAEWAAEIVSNTPLGYITERDHKITEAHNNRCETAILTAAEQLTEKDL